MDNFQDNVTNFLTAPHIAWTTVFATTTTGLSTMLDLIPNNIGKLASLVGILLSAVLIYVHIRRISIATRKGEIEIAILQKKKEALEHGIQLKRRSDND